MSINDACKVQGCDHKGTVARGWCVMHYSRWREFGDPGPAASQRVRLTDKTCTVERCTTRLEAHGLCVKHLRRMTKYGDVDKVAIIHDNETRFFAIITKRTDGCWLWTGSTGNTGYARGFFSGKRWLVHRWAYTHFVGPIPDGFVIDHLCRRITCVNPAHLEAVTQQENIRRSLPQRGPRT